MTKKLELVAVYMFKSGILYNLGVDERHVPNVEYGIRQLEDVCKKFNLSNDDFDKAIDMAKIISTQVN